MRRFNVTGWTVPSCLATVALTLMLLLWSGCGKGLDDQRRGHFKSCVESLEKVAKAPAEQRLELIAKACPHACPGLATYGETKPEARASLLLKECSLACSEAAAGQFTSAKGAARWRGLIKVCGREHYGLPSGKDHHLTAEWFVLYQVGRWIAETVERADGRDFALVARLGVAGDELRVPLPLALPAISREPPASSQFQRPVAPLYGVLTPDQLTVAARPSATLTTEGARLSGIPGGAFPGTATDPTKLAKRLEELLGQMKRSDFIRAVRARAAAAARTPKAGKQAAPEKPLEPTATALLLAAADLPASRVATAVGGLGEHAARLAVANDDGLGAHGVSLCAPQGAVACNGGPRRGKATRPPALTYLIIADDGVHIAQVNDKGTGRRSALIGPVAEAKALRAVLDQQRAGRHANEPLWLKVTGGASVAQLVAVLDAAHLSGVRAAILDPGETSWLGKPVGRYAAAAWKPRGGTVGDDAGDDEAATEAAAPPKGPKGKVSLGKPAVRGGLKRNVAQQLLAKQEPAIRGCYEARLADKKKLQGTMKIQLLVTRPGSVKRATVKGFKDRKVAACVTGVLKKMSFPKARRRGNRTVKVTAKLSPAK